MDGRLLLYVALAVSLAITAAGACMPGTRGTAPAAGGANLESPRVDLRAAP